MIHYLVEVYLVLVPVVDCDGKTLRAESSSPSDSVQIVLRIADLLVARSHCGHVKVQNNLHLWHVDTSRKHVCGDNNADLARLELGDHLVSL